MICASRLENLLHGPLMLEQELLRVQQCPADVFHRQLLVTVGSQVLLGGVDFGGDGTSTQCRQIQLVDDLFIRLVGGDEFGDPTVGVAELVVHHRSIDHLQRLRQVRLVRPFALASHFPLRLAGKILRK